MASENISIKSVQAAKAESNYANRKFFVLLIGIWTIYSIVFLSLYPSLGPSVGALQVVPIIIFAWIYGIRAGLITTIAVIFWDLFVLFPILGASGIQMFWRGGLMALAADLFLASIVGWLHNLNARVRIELAERQRTEAALQRAHDNLETEINRRTAELVASENKYRLLLKQAADGIFLSDESGKFIAVNDKACDMTGYTREELLFMSPTDVVADKDKDNVIAAMRELKEGQFVIRERTIQQKDGTLFPVEVSAKLIGGQIQSIVRDITERVEMAETLKRERDYITAIVETINALIIVLDRKGRIVNFNRACQELTGYKFDEVNNRVFWDFLLDDSEKEGVCKTFSKLQAGQFPNNYENCWVTRTGEKRLIAWSNSALVDLKGEVEFIIGTGIDITERKQLEAQFLQSQKMEAVGQLAGGVAHDFNNLLTAINGYSELALMKLNDPTILRKHIEGVINASDKAASLTRQLLTFSRKQMLELKVVNLNNVVAGMKNMVLRLIGENIKIKTNLAENLGNVKADAGQIEQVILNLVVNARDAMPQGGQISIETRNIILDEEDSLLVGASASGSYTLLSVKDNGNGMSEEVRQRIFEPFFTTKEAGKGTGLGLSTVYGIVKQTGGCIQAQSQVGVGTTFDVYLPKTEGEAETLKNREENEVAPGTETILLVEDEDIVRKLLREVLEMQGYRVIEASNAKSALSVTENHQEPIHLLITDIVMPEMNGLELAQQLKKVRPQTQVVYMSGYTDNAVQDSVLKNGVNFIQKPYSIDNLTQIVRKTLDSNT